MKTRSDSAIVHLVRHPETLANAATQKGDYASVGGVETDLSATGYFQCERFRDFLERHQIEIGVLGSSDSYRAKKMAELIKPGLANEARDFCSPTLREINRGPHWAERDKAQLDLLNVDYALPKGESMRRVATRALNGISEAIDLLSETATRERVVLLVTHGVTIKSVLWQLTQSDPTRAWNVTIDNTSVTSFRYNPILPGNTWELIRVNALPHLDAPI